MPSIRILSKDNVVCMGKRSFSDKDNSSRDRTVLYFGFKDPTVEGMGALNFSVFDNNRQINPKDIEVNSSYSISYHRDDRYYTLDAISKK